MFAADVMTHDVVTVRPDATIKEVAELLLAKGISGVPVVDATGALAGIISEGDLIHRVENDTEKRRSWWLRLFADSESLAQEFIKSHARKAKDVMSPRVITVKPDTPLGEISALLEKSRIKRVPVVDGGRIVGIISRSNLLKGLVRLSDTTPKTSVADAALRQSVLAQLDANDWADTSRISVSAKDGSVELWGIVKSEAEKDALRVAAELTPGVRAVVNNVVIQTMMPAS